MFLFFIKHLQFEIYRACVCVLRRELDPFVIHFALKVVCSGSESADLYGNNGDIFTFCDREVIEIEPSGRGVILDGICVTATAINKDLVIVTTLRIPELLEAGTEGKASCLKVLLRDGFWLPVPNVSEGQEDAGGDCCAQVAVWVFRANCSKNIGVKLINAIERMQIIVYIFGFIQEFFGSCSEVNVLVTLAVRRSAGLSRFVWCAGVCRGGGAEAIQRARGERRGGLDR